MNRNLEAALNVIAAWAIPTVLALMIVSAFSCSATKHKEQTRITLDSTTITLDSAKASVFSSGSLGIYTLDTSKKQTWWNWEKETTTTTTLDETTGKPKQRTTHTTERGTGHSQEMKGNTQALDIDWNQVDTSAHKKVSTNQVEKTSDIKVTDKKTNGRPWWINLAIAVLVVSVVFILTFPDSWAWLLAIFRRKQKPN